MTLPDLHEPYNIPLKAILDFAHDWKPHFIQYLGDATNAESVNHWKLDRGYNPDVASIKIDYKNLEDNILLPFKKSCPKARTIYHIGNHEDWFYQMLLRHTYLEGFCEFEKNIDLDKYKMEVIPLNGFKNFGHLYFTHGNYASGDFHAKKMVLHYRKNIRYGHIHDEQSYSVQSPMDSEEKMVGKSIGCLCIPSKMDYLKKKPHKWINSFHIAYIRDDGDFNDYVIVVSRGKFTAPNGKVYSSETF